MYIFLPKWHKDRRKAAENALRLFLKSTHEGAWRNAARWHYGHNSREVLWTDARGRGRGRRAWTDARPPGASTDTIPVGCYEQTQGEEGEGEEHEQTQGRQVGRCEQTHCARWGDEGRGQTWTDARAPGATTDLNPVGCCSGDQFLITAGGHKRTYVLVGLYLRQDGEERPRLKLVSFSAFRRNTHSTTKLRGMF